MKAGKIAVGSEIQSYFQRARLSYVPPQLPAGLAVNVGTEENCLNGGREGANRVAFFERPNAVERVEVLSLCPSLEEFGMVTFPSYISEMKSLKLLSCPSFMLKGLGEIKVSPAPFTLQIRFSGGATADGPLAHPEVVWPREEMWAIRGIFVAASSTHASRWVGVGQMSCPALEFFKGDLTRYPPAVAAIRGFSTLRFVEVDGVGALSGIADVLPNLRVLSLSQVEARCDLPSWIAAASNLEVLRIFGSQSTVDCCRLVEMDNLKEVLLSGCRRLTNLDALRESKSLRSLRITNCGVQISEQARSEWLEHGFESLVIM